MNKKNTLKNLRSLRCLVVVAAGTAVLQVPATSKASDLNASLLEATANAFYSQDASYDLNGDGRVNFADLALLRESSGQGEGGARRVQADCPSIRFEPSATEAMEGEAFTLTVVADFSCEATLGGGVDLRWDEGVLELVSWDPTPPGDQRLSRPGDIGPGFIDGYGFGDLFGVSGVVEIGSITLQPIDGSAGALTPVELGPDDLLGEQIAGDFYSAVTFAIQEVAFEGSEVTVVELTAICFGNPATIVGTSADDTLVGTPGRDVIAGLEGDDTIDGLEGNDIICGGSGGDVISGGDGNDVIFGEGGGDRISGNMGNDILVGGGGADQMFGQEGADLVFGQGGDDFLSGGDGEDVCNGGGGNDAAGNSCETVQSVP
ncbi:MAG: calcium-binding protein [Pseudomonadota bacterium]